MLPMVLLLPLLLLMPGLPAVGVSLRDALAADISYNKFTVDWRRTRGVKRVERPSKRRVEREAA